MARTLIALAFVCLPAVASAHHGHQVVVQKVFVPLYYHNVSPYLQSEAQIRAIIRDEQRLQAQQAAPQTLAQTAPQSILAQRCAKCHSGPDAKGGHVIDGVSAIDCNVFRRSMEMLAGKGEPPPAAMAAVIKQLQAESKHGEVMDAMLNLPLSQPVAKEPGGLE